MPYGCKNTSPDHSSSNLDELKDCRKTKTIMVKTRYKGEKRVFLDEKTSS